METAIIYMFGAMSGLLVGLLLNRSANKANLVLIERLATAAIVARSQDPAQLAIALAHLDTNKALIDAPAVNTDESPAVLARTVIIDGMDFDVPSDSPLNKMG